MLEFQAMTTRAPIKTAAARAGGRPIIIPVEYAEDRIEEYRFRPGIAATTLDLAEGLRAGSAGERLTIALEIIDATAADEETIRQIRSAYDSGVLDIVAMVELVRAVIQESTGMGPTKPELSADGSEATGATSTAGAPAADWTPPR